MTANFPELASLRGWVVGQDWSAVAAFVNSLADPDDRAIAISVVAGTENAEHFLSARAERDPSTLPMLLLAARLIDKGWAIRSRSRAQYVSRDQFAQFHDHLRQAEQLLIQITAEEPDNVQAWLRRLMTCRGLELGYSECRRRYDRLAEYAPTFYRPQAQVLQQSCPKWSGSWEKVDAFVADRAKAAKPGGLPHALLVEACMERWLEYDAEGGKALLADASLLERLRLAARASVLHPDLASRKYANLAVHNFFAAYFSLAGSPADAAPHFAAIGVAATDQPWEYLGDKAEVFTKYRAKAEAAK